MKIKKISILILFSFIFSPFLFGCNQNTYVASKKNFTFEKINFDVVEKEIFIDKSLPIKIQNQINLWFSSSVVVDGFGGKVEIHISNYNEKISNFDNKKKIDLNLDFKVVETKGNDKKSFNGTVSTFSEISGDFSLNEFDSLVFETQMNLIDRLILELKSIV